MRVNDIFDDFYNEGIFTYLDRFDVPWKDQQISTQLNLVYHTKSGQKFISPLIRSQLDADGKLTEARRLVIARVIVTINKNKWDRLFNLSNVEYDPIANYDLTETEHTTGNTTNTNSITNTKNNSFNKTGTDTKTTEESGEDSEITKHTGTNKDERTFGKTIDRDETKGGTDTTTETHSNSDTVTHNVNDTVITNSAINTSGINLNFVNGFNTGTIDNNLNDKQTTDTHNNTNSTVTDTATNTDVTQYGHKIEKSIVNGGTLAIDESENGTDNTTTTHNTQDTTTLTKGTTTEDTINYNTTETQTGGETTQSTGQGGEENNRSLRRFGNIGVTSSQMLIASEIQAWQWKYYEEVFKDIDKLITLVIY